MKKYIDWMVEGVVLSAMVIAFLFVVGKNQYGHISFRIDVGIINCIIAIFACVVAILLLYVKKSDKRYITEVSVIYALENLIIYYVALGDDLFSGPHINIDALPLTFLVGFIAWPITKYEVESIIKRQ